MKNLIIKNLTSNYLLSLVGMALGFFLVPFLIVKLGKEAFGLIILAEMITGFFEIVTVSVRIALSRHATFALSKNKMDDFVEYLSTGRMILFVSSAFVLLLGSVISLNFPYLFKVPPEYFSQSRILFLTITLAIAFSIPNAASWSVLYAKQRFDLINIASSLGVVIRAVCLFVYFSVAPRRYVTLVAYGMIYLMMIVVQNVMIYFFHKRLMPGVRFSRKYFRRSKVREILSFSVHTSISRASSLLYQETAHIIINVYWGPAFNAIYAIAMKFPTLMSRLFSEPSWTLMPTFTDLVARGDHERFERLFFMYSKMLAIVTFPFCFALIFFSRPLVYAWVGPDFAMAANLMVIIVAQQLIGIPFSMTGCVFNAYGKVKIPSFVSLAMGILNVILCLLLGVTFHMKLYGIALSGIIVATFCGEGFYPSYVCRVAGFSLRRYWMESMIKPFLMCVPVVGGGILFLKIAESTLRLSPLMFFVIIMTTGIHYVLSYYILLSALEKKNIHEILQMVSGKLTKTSVEAPGEERLA